MSISVLVPTFITNEDQLGMSVRCIELAKNKTKLDFELVIVETCSDYLIDYADLYLYERKRTTATKSINRGFNLCSGDFICLLTNDVILNDGWLECLQECFDKSDCGLSTLATTQLGHKKAPIIQEGIWFSVAMMRKEDAHFDENYINSWDDSDLITRVYLRGDKMYRNYKCVVDHITRSTHGVDDNHISNFNKNRDYYMDKYKNFQDERIYQVLTRGTIV